jgi:hypothetical protein
MTNIGFIHGMHPKCTNHDMLKSKLTPYMKTVEIQLLVESKFYYKNKVHLDTKVVKVQVDSNEAATARNCIAKAFSDETFLQYISKTTPSVCSTSSLQSRNKSCPVKHTVLPSTPILS